jgi:rare lipoprotein A
VSAAARLLCAGWLCAGLAGCVAPPAPVPAGGAGPQAPAAVADAPAAAPPAAAGQGANAPQPSDAVPQPPEPQLLQPDGVPLGSGLASWYGQRFQGRRTASGERFDSDELTAAHRTLPFGARVCVRSLVNGRAVVVRINDRGPFSPDRVIDLSEAAAQALGMIGLGIKPVELWQLQSGDDACPDAEPQGDDLAARIQAAGAARAKPAPKGKKPRRPRKSK